MRQVMPHPTPFTKWNSFKMQILSIVYDSFQHAKKWNGCYNPLQSPCHINNICYVIRIYNTDVLCFNSVAMMFHLYLRNVHLCKLLSIRAFADSDRHPAVRDVSSRHQFNQWMAAGRKHRRPVVLHTSFLSLRLRAYERHATGAVNVHFSSRTFPQLLNPRP